MKLLITGTRNGCTILEDWLDYFVRTHGQPNPLIAGGARGVDTQAILWALSRKIPHIIVHADWEQYGKKAGPIRNQQMIDMINAADWCIAFLTKNSIGTRDCLNRAIKKKVNVLIVRNNGYYEYVHYCA